MQLREQLVQKDKMIAELTLQRDVAIDHIVQWCIAIDTHGAGWDDWDEYYKDAMWRDGSLPQIRELLTQRFEEFNRSGL